MKKYLVISSCLIAVIALANAENPWSKIKVPTTGDAQSIGNYDAGCLRGAQDMPVTGEGYQVMRLSRTRFYGHPALLGFLHYMGQTIKGFTGRDVLVGDMGQPRGGPTLSGHASHQTGLDVDVWYMQPSAGKILTYAEREKISAPSMVVPEFEKLTKYWTDDRLLLLKTAAEFSDVERIFVNPVIKRRACELSKKLFDDDGLWLRKLRPWWFHEDHFHVRLKCQPGSPTCVNQAPPPEGNGCGEELASWFTQESKEKSRYMRTHPTPSVMPTLPAECAAVLMEP